MYTHSIPDIIRAFVHRENEASKQNLLPSSSEKVKMAMPNPIGKDADGGGGVWRFADQFVAPHLPIDPK